MEFKELQDEIVQKAKAADACREGVEDAKGATNEEELLAVIYKYLDWCSGAKIISNEYFAKFDQSIFLKSGIQNSGEENSGWSNTGDRNTGDRNTGDSNTGDRNTGHSNTGDRNTGHWNTGDRNTGHSNTGEGHSGAFCTGEAEFIMFNKPCNWKEKDFINSKAWNLLCQVDTKQWIQSSIMTNEEKAANRGWDRAEGYYKDIPFKQSFTDKWNNWSEENKKSFLDLPNFDTAIFLEITGVDINAK